MRKIGGIKSDCFDSKLEYTMLFFVLIFATITTSFRLDMNLIDQMKERMIKKSFEKFLTPKLSLDGLSMGGVNVEVNDSFLWLMRIAREKNRRNKNNNYLWKFRNLLLMLNRKWWQLLSIQKIYFFSSELKVFHISKMSPIFFFYGILKSKIKDSWESFKK